MKLAHQTKSRGGNGPATKQRLSIVLAAAGARLASEVFQRSPLHGDLAPESSGYPSIGENIPTSFGALAVEHVEEIAGPTAEELGDMTHGIHGLVPADSRQVQVSIRLMSRLDRAVAYSPTQFRLMAGSTPIGVSSSSLREGRLAPQASIEGRLTFVAPRAASSLGIEYLDPDRATPILVDLGPITRPATSVPDGSPPELEEQDAHGHQH